MKWAVVGRYKFTILFVLILLVAAYGAFTLVKDSQDCRKKGGVYARTMYGTYKCLQEIK